MYGSKMMDKIANTNCLFFILYIFQQGTYRKTKEYVYNVSIEGEHILDLFELKLKLLK